MIDLTKNMPEKVIKIFYINECELYQFIVICQKNIVSDFYIPLTYDQLESVVETYQKIGYYVIIY